jgi:hypothetical protein
MDCVELKERTEGILNEAEVAIRGTKDPTSAAICQTLIACTRALCCELSALRQMAGAIESDLTNIELKMPD